MRGLETKGCFHHSARIDLYPIQVKPRLIICTLLALLTCAAFWGVTKCDFTDYDDTIFVTENHQVLGGFTSEGLKWAFTTSEPDYWRPLSWLSHQLDVELFGLNPKGHHLTNLLFHVANTLLLFIALQMMTGANWPSIWVAAMFAIHPLHVESVAWVAERKDVLNGFFWMLTMLVYAHYARRPNFSRYALVLFTFALGLMSKPMAVTLPCALLLLDFWPLRRVQWEKRILLKLIAEKIPMLVLAVGLSALALFGQEKMGVVASAELLPLSGRISNAFVSYSEYLRKTIWPSDLAVFYPHPLRWPVMRVILAGVLLLGLTAWVVANGKRRPYLLTGWLWFLGTLVPAIGLVQVGAQAMADRYTYIPLIGVFVMAAWPVYEWSVAHPTFSRPATGLALITLALCVFATGWQITYWRNSLTLFQHALSVTADNSLARLQVGNALMKQGRLAEAEQHLARAVILTPQSYETRCNYGVLLTRQGRAAAAFEQVSEALRLKPDYAPAHAQMGLLLAGAGRSQDAIRHYREAVGLKPDFAEVMNNLAWLLATSPDDKIRNGAEAVLVAERACALTRWDTPTFIGTLAAAYAEAGRFPEAVTAGEKARAVALSKGQPELASKNEALLQLYRAGRAYREGQSAP